MNTKKILSVIIVITMILSSVMCFDFFSVSATDTEKSTYERFEKYVSAENNYGLPDTLDSGKILNAWNWSYANTTELLETIAQQGFGAIQVSPPSEVKMSTKGMHFIETSDDEVVNGWWMFYQNVAFRINQSEDNALGTKADFTKLCEEAHKYGIKIIPEVVVNHMANNSDYINVSTFDSSDPMDHLSEKVAEFEPEIYEQEAFHTPFKPTEYIETYRESTDDCVIEESLTQHAVYDYKMIYNPDLATETQVVQDAVYKYLAELIEAGADGFYFDEVKHVETRYDTYFPSDFWENTLVKIRCDYPEAELYAYGTILNKAGDGRDFSEYTEIMDITDTSSYWGIKDSVCGYGGYAFPRYEYSTSFTQDKVVQYSENSETYIYGASSYLTSSQINKIWALSAVRKDITGVYFARPDERVGRTKENVEKILSDVILGEANITAWANPEVKAVNQFDNFFGDSDELLTGNNNCALAERYDAFYDIVGATVIRLRGNSRKVVMETKNLNDATYIDVISGNVFTVSNGVLSGELGDTGIACLYCTENVYVKSYYKPLPEPDNFPSSSQGCFWEPVGYYTVVMSVRCDTDVYVYAYNNETGDCEYNWPGIRMNYAYGNEYGESVFFAYIPKGFDTIIINDNGDWQINQLTVSESIGIYIKGDGTLGSYEPCFHTWPVEPVKTPGLCGDAEKDDCINIRDATVIQKYVSDLVVKDFDELLADADMNGKINVRDATAIQKYLAGIMDSYNENIGEYIYYY